MSGIAGFIHFDGASADPALVARMTGAMAYRGPDGIEHWVRGSAALGQCMLRTTPESLEERLPLASEDGSLVVVLDGRLDNGQELRAALRSRGARLRDRSDAELLLRAYETWGTACPERLEGDFALVVWDARRRAALCARDRMGYKPLCYHWARETLSFASELHAILALPWVEAQVNEGTLAEYLAAEHYSEDETLWRGVLRLPPAQAMTVSGDGPRRERYWQVDFDRTLPVTRDEEYVEEYRRLHRDAVRRMSRAHRTLACEVSGGLDSSAVFAVAEGLRREGALPAPGLEGYTLTFAGDPEADELEFCRAVGQHLGLEIHEIPPTVAPLDWYRRRARADREFPGYPNEVMLRSLFERARQRGSRVVLGGLGGDEWAGSCWQQLYYAEELAALRWGKLAALFWGDCREAGLRTALGWALRYGALPLVPPAGQELLRALRRRVAPSPEDWLAQGAWLPLRLQRELAARRAAFRRAAPRPRPGRGWQLELLRSPATLLARERMERLASRVGVEVRHPPSDPRLVQLAVSTPERLRVRGGTDRYIHVRAMENTLPAKVLARQDKAVFCTVVRPYLEAMAPELHSIAERRAAWGGPAGVNALYKHYRARLTATRSSSGGRAQWALWNLFGCDALAGAPTVTSPDETCRPWRSHERARA